MRNLFTRFSKIEQTNPGILVSSVPKAGTHLLGRCLELLGYEDKEIGINQTAYSDHNGKGDLSNWDVINKKESFLNPAVHAVHCTKVIPTIQAGEFALGHLLFERRVVECINASGLKHIFIYRDPRDVAISWYRFNTRAPEKGGVMLYYYVYNALETDAERLLTSIKGIPAQGFLPDLYERHYLGRMEWLNRNDTLAIRFEDLVGGMGGGSSDVQLQTVRAICKWIGRDDSDVESVVEELFGKSKTFTGGKVASWKSEFSDVHKDAIKEVAGDVLIELGYESDYNW